MGNFFSSVGITRTTSQEEDILPFEQTVNLAFSAKDNILLVEESSIAKSDKQAINTEQFTHGDDDDDGDDQFSSSNLSASSLVQVLGPKIQQSIMPELLLINNTTTRNPKYQSILPFDCNTSTYCLSFETTERDEQHRSLSSSSLLKTLQSYTIAHEQNNNAATITSCCCCFETQIPIITEAVVSDIGCGIPKINTNTHSIATTSEDVSNDGSNVLPENGIEKRCRTDSLICSTINSELPWNPLKVSINRNSSFQSPTSSDAFDSSDCEQNWNPQGVKKMNSANLIKPPERKSVAAKSKVVRKGALSLPESCPRNITTSSPSRAEMSRTSIPLPFHFRSKRGRINSDNGSTSHDDSPVISSAELKRAKRGQRASSSSSFLRRRGTLGLWQTHKVLLTQKDSQSEKWENPIVIVMPFDRGRDLYQGLSLVKSPKQKQNCSQTRVRKQLELVSYINIMFQICCSSRSHSPEVITVE